MKTMCMKVDQLLRSQISNNSTSMYKLPEKTVEKRSGFFLKKISANQMINGDSKGRRVHQKEPYSKGVYFYGFT